MKTLFTSIFILCTCVLWAQLPRRAMAISYQVGPNFYLKPKVYHPFRNAQNNFNFQSNIGVRFQRKRFVFELNLGYFSRFYKMDDTESSQIVGAPVVDQIKCHSVMLRLKPEIIAFHRNNHELSASIHMDYAFTRPITLRKMQGNTLLTASRDYLIMGEVFFGAGIHYGYYFSKRFKLLAQFETSYSVVGSDFNYRSINEDPNDDFAATFISKLRIQPSIGFQFLFNRLD